MKRIISTVLVCVLLFGCMLVLASCGGPNSDPEKAEANLKAEGYVVISVPAYGVNGVERSITATNGDDTVQIFYFAEDADSEKVYDYVNGLYEKAKEKNGEIDLEIGKSGDMVWFGTSAAIKAAK